MYKQWTAEEEAILESLAGELPSCKIAKKLNRQPWAIKAKASRMGVSLKMETNNFTIHGLAKILEIHPTTIWEWISKKELKALKLSKGLTSHRAITRQAFKSFYHTYGKRKQSLKHVDPEILKWLLED